MMDNIALPGSMKLRNNSFNKSTKPTTMMPQTRKSRVAFVDTATQEYQEQNTAGHLELPNTLRISKPVILNERALEGHIKKSRIALVKSVVRHNRTYRYSPDGIPPFTELHAAVSKNIMKNIKEPFDDTPPAAPNAKSEIRHTRSLRLNPPLTAAAEKSERRESTFARRERRPTTITDMLRGSSDLKYAVNHYSEFLNSDVDQKDMRVLFKEANSSDEEDHQDKGDHDENEVNEALHEALKHMKTQFSLKASHNRRTSRGGRPNQIDDGSQSSNMQLGSDLTMARRAKMPDDEAFSASCKIFHMHDMASELEDDDDELENEPGPFLEALRSTNNDKSGLESSALPDTDGIRSSLKTDGIRSSLNTMPYSDSNNAKRNIVRMNSQTTVYFPSSSSIDASEATAANDGADPGNSFSQANSSTRSDNNSTRSRAMSDSPMISLAEVYTKNISESHKTLSTSQSARRTLDKFQEYNAACVFTHNPDTEAALPTSLSAFQMPKQKTAASRKVDGGEKFMKVDITKDSTIQPKPVDDEASEEQRREADEDHERMLDNIRSYSSLLAIKENTEKLNILKKEDYLEESEFERILGMTRKEFDAMPKWKRDRKKKEVGLF